MQLEARFPKAAVRRSLGQCEVGLRVAVLALCSLGSDDGSSIEGDFQSHVDTSIPQSTDSSDVSVSSADSLPRSTAATTNNDFNPKQTITKKRGRTNGDNDRVSEGCFLKLKKNKRKKQKTEKSKPTRTFKTKSKNIITPSPPKPRSWTKKGKASEYSSVVKHVGFRPFPYRAHEMICKASEEDPSLIQWFPDGRHFIFHDPNSEETGAILQEFFKHNKFSSFQRQLHSYGFVKIKEGKYKGGFMQPFFRKDGKDLTNCVRKDANAYNARKAAQKKGKKMKKG